MAKAINPFDLLALDAIEQDEAGETVDLAGAFRRLAEERYPPTASTLEAVFGLVEPITRPEDFNRIIRQAKEDRLRASPTT